MTLADKFYIDELTGDFSLRENGVWAVKGNVGPNGAGHGPPLASIVGLYIDIDAGGVYFGGVLIGLLPGGGGGGGSPGPQGIPGQFIVGDDGADGEDSFVPGPKGADSIVPGPPGADSTVPGPQGIPGQFIVGDDGDTGEDAPIIPGTQGARGPQGYFIIGDDGAPGEDAPSIPGPQGPPGADSSVPGPQGLPGHFIVGDDGAPGEDSFVPGPCGSAGMDFVFLARTDQTGDITLTSGVESVIPFKTVVTDTQNAFETVTFKYTPRKTGVYLFGASVFVKGAAAAGYTAVINVIKNNSFGAPSLGGGAFNQSALGTISQAVSSVTAPIALNGTTDYVQFEVYSDLTSPVIANNGGSNPLYTFAWAIAL